MLPKRLAMLCKILSLSTLILMFGASVGFPVSDVDIAIGKGLEYLRQQQNQDTGEWSDSYPVGSTGLAVMAFLNKGINKSDPQIQKALGFIVSKQEADGRIGRVPGYTTAVAIAALRSTGDHAYDEVIRKAKDYYVKNQNADGGWRYDPYYADSDHCVFQWGALGIYEAYEFLGLQRNDATWQNAKRYLTSTQNADGGWAYQSGASYASMTAAGMWSSSYLGIPLTDPVTQKALGWIQNNYTWDTNTGSGSWTRYYQYTLAKALALYGKRGVVDANGVSHDWYSELATKLLAEQQEDGRWTGGQWGSESDILVTAYILLILELGTLPEGEYSITIELEANNSDLYVFDPTGLQVSKNFNNIQEAKFSSGPPQKVVLKKTTDNSTGITAGRYYLEVRSSAADTYNLSITGNRVDSETGASSTFFGPETWADVEVPAKRTQCLAFNVNLIAGVGIVVTDEPHLNPLMELSPSLIEISANPDEVVERTLTVKETSGERDLSNVVISAVDLVVEGQNDKRIPATNITFDPSHFTVPAGGSKEIAMKIVIPSDIDANAFYSGYITAESDDAGTKRATLNIGSLSKGGGLEILELCNIPNPFADVTSFSYYLTKAATDVYIEIFTVSGDMIKKIENAPGSAFFNELPWDGILDSGEEISNGIYVYRVTATDGETTVDAIEKMAVLK